MIAKPKEKPTNLGISGFLPAGMVMVDTVLCVLDVSEIRMYTSHPCPGSMPWPSGVDRFRNGSLFVVIKHCFC